MNLLIDPFIFVNGIATKSNWRNHIKHPSGYVIVIIIFIKVNITL